MIEKELSKHILLIGPSYKRKGGIASVLAQYKEMFENFNFVATSWQAGKSANLILLIKAILIFISQLSRPEIAIVHIHSASNLDFYRHALFVYLAKCFRKKVLLHLHGGNFEGFYYAHPKLAARVCHKADAVIAVSSYFYNLFQTLHLSSRIFLLHNAITPPRTIKTFKKATAPNSKFRLLYIGRINEKKGCFDVLNCIGTYKDKFSNKLEFHLAGQGDTAQMSTIIHEHGIADFVIYHEWLNGKDKDDLINLADCYIQPSYFESFGLSILEAMAHGLPVITSPTGGIPDLIDDGINGIFVTPGKTYEIANAIERLMHNSSERIAMGQRAKVKAQNFYLDKIEKDAQNLYKVILYS